MRSFIRHPTEIPIEIHHPDPADSVAYIHAAGHDVSLGGLALHSHCAATPGEIVEVSIPFVDPPFASRARVAWCKTLGSAYELGVEFLDAADAFRARMVEQICHIERYKKNMALCEGRKLSTEEAALEWISKYAARFAAEANG